MNKNTIIYKDITVARMQETLKDYGIKQLFADGNSKVLDSLVYSQTPMLTCPNCSDCSKTCYAMTSYNRWPAVKKAWDAHTELSIADPDIFVAAAIYEIQKKRARYVRIHSAGDFYSSAYVDLWIAIANACPDTNFWTYTKAYGLNAKLDAALDMICSLPNVNIVDSTPCGRINYGDDNYLIDLKFRIELTGATCIICPCGHDDSIKCGRDCRACCVEKYVLFKQH